MLNVAPSDLGELAEQLSQQQNAAAIESQLDGVRPLGGHHRGDPAAGCPPRPK